MTPGKIVRAVLVALAVGAAAGAAYWQARLAPYYWVSQTRHKSMRRLIDGAAAFNAKHDRLPRSLEEMVTDGVLPGEGVVYYSAMKHRSMFAKKLSYRDCEFEWVFDEKVVAVRIPDAVFAGKRFDFVPEQQRAMAITREVKTVDLKKIKL